MRLSLSFYFSLCISLFFLNSLIASDSTDTQTPKKLIIITSLFPQYDFAKTIGGDKVEVSMLLPSGAESHSYEPTPSEMTKIADADLFIYTGDYMEPWAGKILSAVKDSGKVLGVDVSKGIELKEGEDHDEDDHDGEDDHHDEDASGHGHSHEFDPHIWLDPVLAMVMVDNITDALVNIDSSNANYYKENSLALKNELKKLDSDIKSIVAKSPTKTLVFGGRFAFLYFIDRYGLNYIGAYDSCGAGSEPSVKRIVEVADYVKKNHTPIIFYEEMVEPRISKTISEETGCAINMVHSLHNLTPEEAAANKTYLDLMRENIAAFSKGLQ